MGARGGGRVGKQMVSHVFNWRGVIDQLREEVALKGGSNVG